MSLCFVISRHSFEQLSGIIFSRHQQRFNFIHFSTIFFKVKFNGALGMSYMSKVYSNSNLFGHICIYTLYMATCELEEDETEYFLKIWHVRTMGVCTMWVKTVKIHFLKNFGFFKDVVEYFPNWEQWECVRWEWEVGWCTFWGLHWPSNDKSTFLSRIHCPIQNPALPFSMLGIEYGRKGKVFRTRLQQRALTECWKRCLEHQYSTCYKFNKIKCRWRSRVRGQYSNCSRAERGGGEMVTWIGRGSLRVGSTKGYEGEGLEGRVEWLLGGSSAEWW